MKTKKRPKKLRHPFDCELFHKIEEHLSIFDEDDKSSVVFYVGNEEWKSIPSMWRVDFIRKNVKSGYVPTTKSEIKWQDATIIHDSKNKHRFDIEII